MSDAPDWEVVVFNTALQLPAAERAAYLEVTCREDTSLRQRVQSLLNASERAGSFMTSAAEGLQRPSPSASISKTASTSDQRVEGAGDRVGRYKLLQQIGEGGCGVVYMAEQEEPVRRRVAVKVIKLGMDTRSVIARFEAERQALAMMDHPNIAHVLDAGATEQGRPFFVMELVRGPRITDFCDQANLPISDRLGLFVKVCQAIQHAHQKGIIHRDIKPSNILVTMNDGVAVPKVIDFGIAKATEGRLTDKTLFTAFEQFIGTPAYMSPEQTALTSVDVDTRSDIYSLGVLLYELLTGRTPFDQKELLGHGLEEMRRTIREKDPPRPSTRLTDLQDSELTTVAMARRSEPPQLVHFVRGDLDWVVMRCLEKDRARRYATANGLAVDVQRFLLDEPVAARPPSSLYRLQKLVRRNRLLFAGATAVVGALVLGLGLSTWQFIEKSRAVREQTRLRVEAIKARTEEEGLRHQAEVQELASRQKAYSSDMSLLQQALAEDDLARAQDLLGRQKPPPGQKDLRGWEWRYFWQFCQSDAAFTLCQRSNSISGISFSADGNLLAVGTFDGELTVWDMRARSLVFRRAAFGTTPTRPLFSPQGSLLAFQEGVPKKEHRLVLWDPNSREITREFPATNAIRDLVFCADGRLFANEFSRSNDIVTWDLAKGIVTSRKTGGTPTYSMGTVFTATADGKRFAHVIGGSSHSVRVVDFDGEWETTLRVSDELTTALAFADDGKIIVTGSGYADGAIKLWDVKTHDLVGELQGHRSWVSKLKVLADGKTLMSASADRTVRLWDLGTRRSLRTFRGFRGELWSADISPDGHWLASGGKDGSVVIWNLDAPSDQAAAARTLGSEKIDWWNYSPDGRRVCVVRNRRLEFYDAKTLKLLSEPNPQWTNVSTFAISADLRRLALSQVHGPMSVWDLADGGYVTNFQAAPPPDFVRGCVFLSGDTNLLTFGSDHVTRIWDTAMWREVRSWPTEPGAVAFDINLNAGLILSGTTGGRVSLIDVRTGAALQRFACQSRLKAVALSADTKSLAAASENGTIEVWSTENHLRKALLHGVLLGYHSIGFSPDGQRLAAGSNGQEAIKVWDTGSQQEVATLAGKGSFFTDLSFSPDGNTIAARNWSGVVHFWTAPGWDEINAFEAQQH